MTSSRDHFAREAISTFGVHELNLPMFEARISDLSLPGEICLCGHPRLVHKRGCKLSSTCGCSETLPILQTEDQRPFFHITNGPWESHALCRGIKTAEKLGVGLNGVLKCNRLCEDVQGVGPVRMTRNGNAIAPRTVKGEKHKLHCDRCLDYLSSFKTARDWPSRWIGV